MRYNLAGKQFGCLTVLEPEGRNERRHMVWRCSCSACGGEHSLCAHDIIRTTAQSCTRKASGAKAKPLKAVSKEDKATIETLHRELTAYIKAHKDVLKHFEATGIAGLEFVTREKQAVPILDMTEAHKFLVGLMPLLMAFHRVDKEYAGAWERMYSLAPDSVPVKKREQVLKPIKVYCRVKPKMFTPVKYPRWADVEVS